MGTKLALAAMLMGACGENPTAWRSEEADGGEADGNPSNLPPPQELHDEPTEPGRLCVDEEALLGSEIALYPVHEDEECDETMEGFTFSLQEDWPQNIFLHGRIHLPYCIGIERRQGYITISHERGVVTRRSNFFTWCITPHTSEPEQIIVRSLTAKAQGQLFVP
ncbi:MAG: hypothetical protein AAB588_04695 [Patescibacteria group bacterium]